MAERLQKYLAKAGIGSRRFCEELIKSKKIIVNDEVAPIGTKVSPGDIVKYDGRVIKNHSEVLKVLLLNKPEGVLSSSKREKKFQSFLIIYQKMKRLLDGYLSEGWT